MTATHPALGDAKRDANGLLLDTHTLLWWWTDDPKLSLAARTAIASPSTPVFVSAASMWEISTKHRLGKLPEAALVIEQFGTLIQADGFSHLAITCEHSQLAGQFTQTHADPFDRMLAAQAQLNRLTLVSKDPAFAQFDTQVLW